MERRPEPGETATTQQDRFIETARELGADTDAEALDRVFGKVVPPVVPKMPSPEKTVPIENRDE